MESRRFEEIHIILYFLKNEEKSRFPFVDFPFSRSKKKRSFLSFTICSFTYIFYRVCKHRKLFISQNLIGYVLHRYYFDLYSLMERDRYFVMLLIFSAYFALCSQLFLIADTSPKFAFSTTHQQNKIF